MSEALIRLEELEFAYGGGQAVLAGVDLEIHAGGRVGLLGANGSGKTTILHLIVGLLTPDAGTVYAFGRPRSEEADFYEVRTRAGLVFQDSDDQLFSPTVMEDVCFGPLNLGKSRSEACDIALETLGLLGLSGFEERITYKLSGGEKRLVALATVLAMRPEVLLLDEPTNGLDEASMARITEVLSGLPQAMIIVSHEREFVRELGCDIVAIRDGKLAHAKTQRAGA